LSHGYMTFVSQHNTLYVQQWMKSWVDTSVGLHWKHWLDTCEFITSSAEFWNRWVRLSCYFSRLYNMCPLYIHVTPIL